MPLRSGRAGLEEGGVWSPEAWGWLCLGRGQSRGSEAAGAEEREGRQGSIQQREVAGDLETRSRAAQWRARAGSRLRLLSRGGEGTSQRADVDGVFSKLRFKGSWGKKLLRNG